VIAADLSLRVIAIGSAIRSFNTERPIRAVVERANIYYILSPRRFGTGLFCNGALLYPNHFTESGRQDRSQRLHRHSIFLAVGRAYFFRWRWTLCHSVSSGIVQLKQVFDTSTEQSLAPDTGA
jgi:hypothetical protein